MRVVAIGGGTGLSTLLRGLKKYDFEITAIVPVTDEGGSSGLLRKELGILPPGDIRNNIVALAKEEDLLAKLLGFRFDEGSLKGHNLGNLMIAALTKMQGNFVEAIKTLSDVLAIKGRVLPVSDTQARLIAVFEDGEEVVGELEIVRHRKRIKELKLNRQIKALPEAVKAVQEADLIILGPGSLYTSVIANLLVAEISEAVKNNRGSTKVYICNLMTQPGETTGYRASDHVKEVERYLGCSVDIVVVNTKRPSPETLELYRSEGSEPVEVDLENIQRTVVAEPLLVEVLDPSDGKKKIRHNSEVLAKLIKKMAGW